jgi:TRAP-type C4-dicarboxylate transport system substrate-binding protein
MRRLDGAAVALVVGLFLLVMEALPPAAQAPVVLKAVTAWDKNQPFVDLYMEWIKRVNAKAGGKLRIDYVGGPEVYPSFEQLDPLKRGIIATVVTSTAYVAGALPEVNATWFGFGAPPSRSGPADWPMHSTGSRARRRA